MIVVEKLTKVLFVAVFGWVIVMLALETVIRRRIAARKKAELKLRPTVVVDTSIRRLVIPSPRRV